MADYRKIVSIYKNKNKGFSWRMDNVENPPCETGFSNTILGNKQNNTSFGISWSDFVLYSKQLGYEPNCENFKQMPDTIYNLIFKKIYWDSVKGDKIKNQGVANVLVESKGLKLMIVFEALKKLGYVRQYSSSSISENITNSFTLIDSDIDFINKLDADGKSHLLFDELTKDFSKDKLYWISKAYVLRTIEKIALGLGFLFIGYLTYNIIKK